MHEDAEIRFMEHTLLSLTSMAIAQSLSHFRRKESWSSSSKAVVAPRMLLISHLAAGPRAAYRAAACVVSRACIATYIVAE